MEGSQQAGIRSGSLHRNILDCCEVYTSPNKPTQYEDSQQQQSNTLAVLEKNYIFDKGGHKSVILTRMQRHLTTRKLSGLKQCLFSVKELPNRKTRAYDTIMENRFRQETISQYLSDPVVKGFCLSCIIQVEASGVFMLSPIYRMYSVHNGKFLMAARKVASGFTEYAISSSSKLIETSNKWCVARLRSNLFSTEWLLTDCPESEEQSREIAFISYKTNLFGLGGPREVTVGVPLQKGNTRELPTFTIEKTTSLKEAYEQRSNALVYYSSQKPVYDIRLKKNRLQFDGCGIDEYDEKNLILENEQERSLICGRRSPKEFYVEIRNHLSPLQAFAICLSNFDKKLFVQ